MKPPRCWPWPVLIPVYIVLPIIITALVMWGKPEAADRVAAWFFKH